MVAGKDEERTDTRNDSDDAGDAPMPEFIAEFLPSFLEEAGELTGSIQQGLEGLEKYSVAGGADFLKDLERDTHSLKGASMTMGLERITNICHHMEEVFRALGQHRIEMSEPVMQLLYECCDALMTMLESMGSSRRVRVDVEGLIQRSNMLLGSEVETETLSAKSTGDRRISAPTTASRDFQETVRVPTVKMDQFLNLSVELVIARNRMRSLGSPLETLEALNKQERRAFQSLSESLAANAGVERIREDEMETMLNEVVNCRARERDELESFHGHFEEALDRMDRLVEEVRRTILDMRMVPVSMLFRKFPRSLREMTRALDKKVELVVEGEDTRIDKRAVEELSDPLTHLIRNAVDHGIETASTRRKAGKQETGRIGVKAFQEADKVIIEISDDGAGIDIDAIREKAVSRGFVDREEAGKMLREEVYDLLFLQGLSTTEMITELSGRGVGMDVVKRNVENLNGAIEISSVRGEGTHFRISLPLTLATTGAFLVECRGNTLAIPLFSVVQSLRCAPESLQHVKGRKAIYWQGELVPAVQLGGLLSFPELQAQDKEPAEKLSFLLLRHGNKKIAVQVDNVIGMEEIVIKSLGSHLRRTPSAAGSSILGTGSVAVIVDVAGLFHAAQLGEGSIYLHRREAAEMARKRRRVLLVEDQLTTRLLEKSILEAAGFEVEAVEDGLAAMNRVLDVPVDIVITDVQMPRMNGWVLTKKLKEDERFSHIPVVIVSSLDREEDRRKGLEVGADAFILKKGFDQETLIQTINQLLGPDGAK